jgi:hypothetical protein
MMRNLFLFMCLVLFGSQIRAQSIFNVTPGTEFFVKSGTTLSTGGLTITPSADFNLDGASLMKSATTSQHTANNHISRVYQFNNATASFSGSIHFKYEDSELNGLSEPGLRVNIHDGKSWQLITSNTNDDTNNYVVTDGISDVSLKEITLADVAAPLPLQWGLVSAYRISKDVKIEWNTKQEFNVNHFTLERSLDSRTWNTVIDNIPATNTAVAKQYVAIDNNYNAARLFYRLKQTDKDGKSMYSPIAAVASVKEASQILVYPNPVQTGFYIGNIAPEKISQVQLYNNSGAQVKTWSSSQSAYELNNIPTGIYHLRVQLKDGSSQYFKLNKQ